LLFLNITNTIASFHSSGIKPDFQHIFKDSKNVKRKNSGAIATAMFLNIRWDLKYSKNPSTDSEEGKREREKTNQPTKPDDTVPMAHIYDQFNGIELLV
jgi:hypothetical protein